MKERTNVACVYIFREEITLATICLVFESLFSRLFPRNTFSRPIILLPSRTTLKIFHSRWNGKDLLLLSRFYLDVQLTTRFDVWMILNFTWRARLILSRGLSFFVGALMALDACFLRHLQIIELAEWLICIGHADKACERSPFALIRGGQKRVSRKLTKYLIIRYLWSLKARATAACLFAALKGRRRGVGKSSNQLLPLISELSLKCASKSALLIESITR